MNYYYLPSESNPADDGTRNAPLRKAEPESDHIAAANDNQCSLFDEEEMKFRFQRGIPRGTAGPNLICHFKSARELDSFLQKRLRTPCTISKDVPGFGFFFTCLTFLIFLGSMYLTSTRPCLGFFLSITL